MEIPEDLRYTREHEWARLNKKTMVVTIGITDFAQSKLGEVVHVDLPEEGDEIQQEEPFGSVESVKAVSDLFAPLTGVVMESNDALFDAPEIVNDDPYGDAWMIRIKVKDAVKFDDLMAPEEYRKFLESQEGEA